jgi:hypothetical protein
MENTNITNTTEQAPVTTESVKMYTQEELQAEADRRVTQALQKKEKEMGKKLTEAEKLAKMSTEDQYKYKLEQKEAELMSKEKEYTLRDNKIAAMKVLSEKEIPADLVDFVVNEDADVMMANINTLDKYIKTAVANQVKARLASPTPTKGLPSNTEMSRAEFDKLPFAKKVELQTNNRELYNKLMGK